MFFSRHLYCLQVNAHLVSPELQDAIFDLSVANGMTTGAAAFAQELLKRGILFERITNCAMEHPNENSEIVKGLVLSTTQFSEFLEELPTFPGEISIELCSLLRKVLSHF
jgi:hypothetical protein